ncbi:hypothetical protein QY895_09280 [Latilactobacillus sakei]
MQDLATLYPQKTWSVVNQQFSADQGQLAFAHANTLLALTKECQQPIIHFWTLEKTVILGMMDTKLPELTAATDQLTAAGYHYFVRNSWWSWHCCRYRYSQSGLLPARSR